MPREAERRFATVSTRVTSEGGLDLRGQARRQYRKHGLWTLKIAVAVIGAAAAVT